MGLSSTGSTIPGRCFWHLSRVQLDFDHRSGGSPLRCDPRLPSGSPPGCPALGWYETLTNKEYASAQIMSKLQCGGLRPPLQQSCKGDFSPPLHLPAPHLPAPHLSAPIFLPPSFCLHLSAPIFLPPSFCLHLPASIFLPPSSCPPSLCPPSLCRPSSNWRSGFSRFRRRARRTCVAGAI